MLTQADRDEALDQHMRGEVLCPHGDRPRADHHVIPDPMGGGKVRCGADLDDEADIERYGMTRSRRDKLLGYLAGAAMLALLPAAHAAQITAGPGSANQFVHFTPTGTGLAVAAPQVDFDGAALDTANPGAVGGAWLFVPGFTAGPEGASGLFPAGPNTGTFKYEAADGDQLVQSIRITQVQDDTSTPKLYFVGHTDSISGDAAFLAEFGAALDVTGDFVVNDIGAHLSSLTGPAQGTISALEVVPGIPVREPSALGLLGGALLALWLVCNRKNIRLV